jgi:DNA-binding beta-propeller fold protein YncE
MPAGRNWGSSSAVDLDPDGESIWVAERCAGNIGACTANPGVNMIMKFDKDGNLVRSFGAGYINWPHGIHVDYDGNVWVTDGRDNNNPDNPPDQLNGHQVHKFSPTGVHMLAIGMPGGGREPDYLFQPNDVQVAPNGDIFIAEGHGNGTDIPQRVLKFNAQGEFLMAFGRHGSGPGEFIQAHALAMDSRGRLFVGDRSNNRVQIFDQNGNFIDMWYQFGRPSGIYIDKNDVLYSADSESGSVNPDHGAWLRGIRIGSAITGEVEFLIPDPQPDCRGTCTAEGVVADHNGNIYGAEVGPVGGIKRYVRGVN